MKKEWIFFYVFIIVTVYPSVSRSQLIARFVFTAANKTVATPVSVDLDQLTAADDSSLSLRDVTDQKNTAVPFQVEHGYHRFLWWLVKAENAPLNKKHVFELLKNNGRPTPIQPVAVTDQDGALVIEAGGKKVLQYNYKTNYPPEGVDTVFKRSGFIHPLWSPAGNVLTQINPPDHRHHVGIWNPWTDVIFEGKKVDFWNLGDKKGTVRFARFIAKETGPVYGGFKALQEHVVFNNPSAGLEKVAMNEVWDVRVFNVGPHMWLWDFTAALNCATTDTVFLKEYRYGGFGFRATPEWNNQNSKVITSEGKTRKEADAGTARWCMIDGDIKNGHSGIVFMSSPRNYNFPEPMRVWPENMNKRGDVFFSFSPTRNKDWTLVPGNDYVLRYRMLVFDGIINPQEAEAAWKSFAEAPQVTVIKK